jgi:hypothetical protein
MNDENDNRPSLKRKSELEVELVEVRKQIDLMPDDSDTRKTLAEKYYSLLKERMIYYDDEPKNQ